MNVSRELGGRVAIVSHDAGGAELVSSYARRHQLDAVFAAAGPARGVCEGKIAGIVFRSVADAVSEADWVLCGSSGEATLEFEALGLARELGKHSVTFLDHWVNYEERFVRNGECRLPDEIWVGDDKALELASELFPRIRITLVENPYFNDLRDELSAKRSLRPPGGALRVLYIGEPLSESARSRFGNERHWGYTEEDALRFFLANRSVLGGPIESLVVRPHPAEAPAKYDWVPGQVDVPVTAGGSRPLLDEIVDSDLVIGCNSMALVVALLADKRVFSCIPPGGAPCRLPHAEIVDFKALLASRADARHKPVFG